MSLRRREAIALLSGLGAILPFSSLAQQRADFKLVGILNGSTGTDPAIQSYVAAIVSGLADEGWRIGVNLEVEARFNEGSAELSRQYAAELVALGADVIVVAASPNAVAAASATSEIPIVFYSVGDPLRLGLVDSFATPGRNATGLTKEGDLGGKYLDLLYRIDPSIRRAAMIFNPEAFGEESAGASFLAAAAQFGVGGEIVAVHSLTDIASTVANMAGDGCLVVASDNFTFSHRREVLSLVEQHSIPALIPFLESVVDGALIAYSIDRVAASRAAGALAGSILNGQDPATIPVRAPTEFVLGINLRTAAAQGLVVPLELLAIADLIVE